MSAEQITRVGTDAADRVVPSARSHPLILVVASTLSATLTGVLIGWTVANLAGGDMPLWLTARATGIAGYVLLTLVTLMGIVLAHPQRSRWRWVAPVTRLRLHVLLTVFALAFVACHIVVLAIDPWAEVGWAGALLPMGAAYRPFAVTLGLLSLWAGLVAGISAAFAGRGTGRVWRPLHRLAAAVWVLAWLHGVLAGTDTAALLALYIGSGVAVLALAVWRYSATRPNPLEVVSR